MKEQINIIRNEIDTFIPKNLNDLKEFKYKFFSKKHGKITFLMKMLKELPIYKKKIFGNIINKLKQDIKKKILKYNKQFLSNNKIIEKDFDITKPGNYCNSGSLHPISILTYKIINILTNIGFSYVESLEIENDWHNFTALNIPIYHPSRDHFDTFFINKNPDILLRTHTSSTQIRYMQKNNPPMKIISVGKVYRNETISSKSYFMFHQAEGFHINKHLSFCDLKKVIYYLLNYFFGNKKIRFRSSYFPFTRPSAEVDIYHNKKWLEIIGCGMIEPKVLNNVGIDSNVYSGFAFGLGIERLALVTYKIDDIRMYFNNDIRFLQQFSHEI